MLAPVLTMRENFIQASYDHENAISGTKFFIEDLPYGQKTYWETIGAAYASLYQQVLEPRDESIYLDKTPRYYLIIEELKNLFPSSRQLILVRNPIAILASVCDTWCRGDLNRLSFYKSDLLKGSACIFDAIRNLNSNQVVVRYEELVSEPKRLVNSLYDWIGIGRTETSGSYSAKDINTWKFGDKKEISRNRTTKPERATAWKEHLLDSQFWRLANDYIEIIGDEALHTLGYEPDLLKNELVQRKPSKFSYWKTKPLSYFMNIEK